MVTPKGQAKVLDFGLARLIRPVDEASVEGELSNVTRARSSNSPHPTNAAVE